MEWYKNKSIDDLHAVYKVIAKFAHDEYNETNIQVESKFKKMLLVEPLYLYVVGLRGITKPGISLNKWW